MDKNIASVTKEIYELEAQLCSLKERKEWLLKVQKCDHVFDDTPIYGILGEDRCKKCNYSWYY